MSITPTPVYPPGPATDADVASYLDLGALSPDEATRLARIVAAVNSLVMSLPIADASDGAETWPARVTEGATMLAGRIWRRKDTPSGLAAVGDLGPVYVQRSDPDVALLLGMGPYGKPAVGY